ncbi:MAG: WecB/TagA/CpsF family glycosyltransferase [Deltaproteobacteria bacterium]|nr:WecB/TagA/CpsF family glycosyltransferase [Deltaproteobacteria bacterium]
MNASESSPRTQTVLGVSVHPLSRTAAIERIMQALAEPPGNSGGCRFVVTPNLDHARLLRDHRGLQSAYAQAWLVVADGMPLVWAAKLMGQPLPERIAGSDLVPGLLAQASPAQPLRYFLLGAPPGVAEQAALQNQSRYPRAICVGTLAPELGFENDEAQCDSIVKTINAAEPALLIIGLGAPKQELWIAQHHHKLSANVAICAGATIEFMAGKTSRAPQWMQNAGLEWVHRMSLQPKRLMARYARDAAALPGLVWQDWRRKKRAKP